MDDVSARKNNIVSRSYLDYFIMWKLVPVQI